MTSGSSKARDAEVTRKDSETTQESDAGGQGREPLTEELSSPHPPLAHRFSVAVSHRAATCSSQTHDAHLNLAEGVA